MKEVDCVHSMGVSSHSSNTLDCQRTVNSLSLGGEETLLTVMLVIEQMDIKYDTPPHTTTFSKGQLRLYLLCHSTLIWTL